MILHLITDRRRLAGDGAAWPQQRACLVQQVRYAVAAGIDIVQIRERDLEAGALFALACECVALAAGSRTRIVVNDRVDVAIAAGAQGVHLRGDSILPATVRRLAPPGFLIGRSVHAAEEAAGLGAQVDYLVAGTVWATSSKPAGHRLLGADGLAAIVQVSPVPVLAIGGITLQRLPAVAAAGAAGVAAIGLFIHSSVAADTLGECRAIPLHDLAQAAAGRFAASAPPATR